MTVWYNAKTNSIGIFDGTLLVLETYMIEARLVLVEYTRVANWVYIGEL